MTPHLIQLVAERWHEIVKMDRAHLAAIITASSLTDDDLKKLLSDKNVYPQLTGAAGGAYTIKIMKDGEFPQVINTNKMSGAVDLYDTDTSAAVPGIHGVLGQPENNLYANKPAAQPNPAI